MREANKRSGPLQATLFEENYLLRTIGSIGRIPDVALTELVANAWDAGASKVEISIPEQAGSELSVEDDGTGMTAEQFRRRWMTLGYNRLRHQGRKVEFPPSSKGTRRRAFGHNGIGRHAMLCFADEYVVETRVQGAGWRYRIGTSSEEAPFKILEEQPFRRAGSGTRLSCIAVRAIPSPERLRLVLAARFLSDPQFKVLVNGKAVPLQQHFGFIESRTLTVAPGIDVEVSAVDSSETARTGQQHGVAFWVGKRLVGSPGWMLGERQILDGRTRFAKRLTFLVRSDDLHEFVESDWSSFRPSETTDILFRVVAEYVEEVLLRFMKERSDETRDSVLEQHRTKISGLAPVARMEIAAFATEVAREQPSIAPDTMSVAVQAVIRLEESRSGKELLNKLTQLSSEDVEGLNRLLAEWTVRDALTVLDEIGKRIRVLEALEKLVADKNVDELSTIHPLMTQSRWIFGPEYDSPLYSSNKTIKRAVERLFGVSRPPSTFTNARSRPDLIFREDATISAVATEDLDPDDGSKLSTIERVLVIELKRGHARIERKEVDQAVGYVEELMADGVLDGQPLIHAYVVGYQVDGKVQTRKLGSGDLGKVFPVTYDRLIRTAGARLFRLREHVQEQYPDVAVEDLAGAVRTQGDLFGIRKASGGATDVAKDRT